MTTPFCIPGVGVEDDPGRPALSVCIVGQDMARRIGPLLDQASLIANEIVYVDGGSKDNSEEVVSRYPKVRFITRPFDGNIARQKNFAFDRARCEWILELDTDELLSPNALRLMPRLLRAPAKSVRFPRYWLVNDESYVRGRCNYPDRQTRLFRNCPEMRYVEDHPIHHPFPPSVNRPYLRLKHAHILHYCLIWLAREEREEKVRRYADADPRKAGLNVQYLYEENPAGLGKCEEGWRDGGTPYSRGLLGRAKDRMALWRCRFRRGSGP